MNRKLFLYAMMSVIAYLFSSPIQAQDKVRFCDLDELTIDTRIDSTHVFAYRLTESRSTRGAIWNTLTHEAETPQMYSEVKLDTLDGTAVVRLYRQVVWGNHPLNGWETWTVKENKWVKLDEEDEQ